MIVVDTSALVDYLSGNDARARQVRGRLRGERLAAPHAVDLECASSLQGLVLGRKLPAQEATRALAALHKLRIARYSHRPLMRRVWELQDNMWPYDASYIALAELLDVPVITTDGKLARVPGLRCVVEQIREG